MRKTHRTPIDDATRYLRRLEWLVSSGTSDGPGGAVQLRGLVRSLDASVHRLRGAIATADNAEVEELLAQLARARRAARDRPALGRTLDALTDALEAGLNERALHSHATAVDDDARALDRARAPRPVAERVLSRLGLSDPIERQIVASSDALLCAIDAWEARGALRSDPLVELNRAARVLHRCLASERGHATLRWTKRLCELEMGRILMRVIVRLRALSGLREIGDQHRELRALIEVLGLIVPRGEIPVGLSQRWTPTGEVRVDWRGAPAAVGLIHIEAA